MPSTSRSPFRPPRETGCGLENPLGESWTRAWLHPAHGAQSHWSPSRMVQRDGFRTSSNEGSLALSECSPTDVASAMRATVITTMFRPCCVPCRPDRRSHPGWSAPTRFYGLGIARPAPLPVGSYIRSGYLKTGRTLGELAQNAGIDPAGLERTVAEFNRHAERGEDPEFGRGSTIYNRYQGDQGNQPNPCVAPLARGPFYAVKVVAGSFGTFVGLKTDVSARVLNEEGAPIPGLYAAGTDMASVMGGYYPAGGINIGPAMTFGYIAGLHAAGQEPVGAG
jgi:FAD binding domain-containing protein